MLQSLLQPRENQRSKMIGAMPAVAVRHERRRAEKRGGGRRPSQLALPSGRAPDDAPPSPDHRMRDEIYVCFKVTVLHAVVGSLLLGVVVLVVGLVQLSPGAEAAQHRFYLMGAGAILVGVGLSTWLLRCLCLHWYEKKYGDEEEEEQDEMEQTAHKNGVGAVESGHKHDHKGDHKHDHKGDHKTDTKNDHKSDKGHKTEHKYISEKTDKPRLKSQSSLGRGLDLVKQPSAASDT